MAQIEVLFLQNRNDTRMEVISYNFKWQLYDVYTVIRKYYGGYISGACSMYEMARNA
jgi:hypothetical protein